ncbi:HAD family phosphatase [Marinilabiliaceae bacterium ANBcel2]|nr:HAD family phosphatase [Marinilabiliaceae bacterium ANBcel2]
MSAISNIIFDLGGVVIDIEAERTKSALQLLLRHSKGDDNIFKSDYFFKYETGLIGSDQFLDALLMHSRDGVTRENLIVAWNSMIIGIPVERLKIIKELSNRFRLFVLSNTNSLHVSFFESMIPCEYDFKRLFEKVYYSHLIGSRKPDTEAFFAVLSDSGLQPRETLFIDDLDDNIECAEKIGMKVLHLNPPGFKGFANTRYSNLL